MAVTCENLVITRGSFRLAADWSLPAGASLALIGPSGAGKSLFLGALAGFEQIAQGVIRVAGADITHKPPAERPVTLMFQDNNLFGHLTLRENVGLGRNPSLRLSMSDRADIDAALAAVGLGELGDRLPKDVSGGQQSRAALARALIRQQPLLLLDEPFSALGPGLRREMLALVGRIRRDQNATLIYVTHNPEDARSADLVSFVDNGSVQQPVETEALFANPPPGLADYL